MKTCAVNKNNFRVEKRTLVIMSLTKLKSSLAIPEVIAGAYLRAS